LKNHQVSLLLQKQPKGKSTPESKTDSQKEQMLPKNETINESTLSETASLEQVPSLPIITKGPKNKMVTVKQIETPIVKSPKLPEAKEDSKNELVSTEQTPLKEKTQSNSGKEKTDTKSMHETQSSKPGTKGSPTQKSTITSKDHDSEKAINQTSKQAHNQKGNSPESKSTASDNLSNVKASKTDSKKTNIATTSKHKQENTDKGDKEKATDLMEVDTSEMKLDNLMVRPSYKSRALAGTLTLQQQDGSNILTFSCSAYTFNISTQDIKFAIFLSNEDSSKGKPKYNAEVLLHFYLKHPVTVGKETKHIQFVGSAKKLKERKTLSKTFVNFVSKLESRAGVPVEVLSGNSESFEGILDGKRNLELQPTGCCLISLKTSPFYILPVKKIDVVVFERVKLKLKTFDMAVVLKDWTKPPIHLKAIADTYQDALLVPWLNSLNIKFYRCPLNLEWNKIMRSVKDDPEAFKEEGGWEFLMNDFAASEEQPTDEEQSGDDYIPGHSMEDADESIPSEYQE